MFISFFYLLKARGIKVSLNEWMTLLEALNSNLHGSKFKDFYFICRAILIKTESDFDKFDDCFLEFFEGIEMTEDIPDEFLDWLNEDEKLLREKNNLVDEAYVKELEELLKNFEERIKEQKEKHSGGNYWVGTYGKSMFGRHGQNRFGIRVGGNSEYKSAVQVAGMKKFRDFRQDKVLETRDFENALRKLKIYTDKMNTNELEFDIDNTIQKTSDNAGMLKIEYKKPRKNSVKLMVLFDSDGSMAYYSRLINKLFKALSKASHLKDLKVYYYHNMIYEHLYKTPLCERGDWVNTNYVLDNESSGYKLIIVSDAAMAPSELLRPGGNVYIGLYNKEPGTFWLNKLKEHFDNTIWFNPILEKDWEWTWGYETISMIGDMIDMFELSLDGIDAGIKKLLNK